MSSIHEEDVLIQPFRLNKYSDENSELFQRSLGWNFRVKTSYGGDGGGEGGRNTYSSGFRDASSSDCADYRWLSGSSSQTHQTIWKRKSRSYIWTRFRVINEKYFPSHVVQLGTRLNQWECNTLVNIFIFMHYIEAENIELSSAYTQNRLSRTESTREGDKKTQNNDTYIRMRTCEGI